MNDAERDALLAELGLTPVEAASPVIDELAEVSTAPVIAKIEELGLVERTMSAPVETLVVPTFDTSHFEGVALDSPQECDDAYRKHFDAHKVHRRVSPGFNQALTKSIRTAIRDERERRKGPRTGFVKAKVARQNAAKVEHVVADDAPAAGPSLNQHDINAIAAQVAALLNPTQ